MKQLVKTFVFAFFVLCITSCGGGSKNSSDNAQQADFTATLTGVGPVQLNLPVGDIPSSFEGLYDDFKTEVIADEMDGDYTVLHFNKSGSTVMTAFISYDNKIESIEVLGMNIASKDGISPGTGVKQLFDRGAKGAMSNDGRLSIRFGKIDYYPSGLKDAGNMKLEQAYFTGEEPYITADDFEKNAKVISFFIF